MDTLSKTVLDHAHRAVRAQAAELGRLLHSSWRRIAVSVPGEEYSVKAREGYYALR